MNPNKRIKMNNGGYGGHYGGDNNPNNIARNLMRAIIYNHSFEEILTLIHNPNINLSYTLRQEDINMDEAFPINMFPIGSTALMMAVSMNRYDVVRELLRTRRSRPELINNEGETALILATLNTDILKELLKPGINSCPECKDQYDSTALMKAALYRKLDSLIELLKPGVNSQPWEQNNRGRTALMILALQDPTRYNQDILLLTKELLRPHVDSRPWLQDHNGDTVLTLAVKNNNIDMVRELLKPEIDSRPCLLNNMDFNALMIAAYYGYVDIVKELLKPGVDSCPGLQNKNGVTALMLATNKGHYEIVRLLLNTNKSCPECVSKSDISAVGIALKNKYVNIYNLLQFRIELDKSLRNMSLAIYNNRKDHAKTNSVLLWSVPMIDIKVQNIVDKLRAKHGIVEEYKITVNIPDTHIINQQAVISYNIVSH